MKENDKKLNKEKNMTAKSKTAAVAKTATVRKTNTRKALMASIRKVERIRAALEKASKVILVEGESVQGDTGSQIADVLGKMNIAIRVTEAEIESLASQVARTFLKA